MKIEVGRYELTIRPETVQDEAYIEEVLGLRRDGDQARVVRVNAVNLSCIAYLRIHRAEPVATIRMVEP